jgi:hypothetical protein
VTEDLHQWYKYAKLNFQHGTVYNGFWYVKWTAEKNSGNLAYVMNLTIPQHSSKKFGDKTRQ